MEWISVKDRLPDTDDYFLIVDYHGNVEMAWFDLYRTKKFQQYDHNVYPFEIHANYWMPLPEPPKEPQEK